MTLKNGNQFRIEGKNGERITFVMTKGTVTEVTTDLDGDVKVLTKGDERAFNLQQGKQLRLIATYVFKENSGESYETHVTGDSGGAESVDLFEQDPGQADQERRYTFDVA